ncbi:MAG: hypothetical protein LBP42_05360 [Treponema sp.]|jgi:hypothetical protein|nr:hypothetical protein [Treponema sp.]
MKRNLLLTGLLSVLLMAGMMFTACPTDDDGGGGGGVPVPQPGDLPGLPSSVGAEYVSNRTEAEDLLKALKTGFQPVYGDVNNLIDDKVKSTENGYTWNVSDGTSIAGLEINAKGDSTSKSKPDNFGDEESGDYEPAVGDYLEESENSYTTIEFTADKTEGGATVYKGNSIVEQYMSSNKNTITGSSKLAVTISANDSRVYGLTVSSGGKGGKIILSASRKGSISKDDIEIPEDGGPDIPDLPITYSGSLKVYGDGSVLYTEKINTKAAYDKAVDYFVNRE